MQQPSGKRLGHTLSVLSGSGTTIIVRWLGSGVQFALNIVLGHALGPAGLGLYYLFYAWARFLGQFTSLGLPSYATRTVSVMITNGKSANVKAFIVKSASLILLFGTLLFVVSQPFTERLSQGLLGTNTLGYMVSLAIVASILFALLSLLVEALKALHRANLALTLEFSALPFLLLFAVGLAIPFFTTVPTLYALIATVVLMLTLVLVSGWLLHKELPTSPKSDRRLFKVREVATFWSFGLLGTLIANLPFLLLPHFATPEEIGEFGVAYRLVALSGTVLAALASQFGPQFARHYARGDLQSLAADFNRSQIYSTLVFTPLLLIMVLFAEPLLSVFGQEFGSTRAVLFLHIMAAGQFINSSTGLTAQYLNMIHREALTSWILLVGVTFMLVSAVVLGGRYGALGVAIAYSGALALQNLAAFFAVKYFTIQFKKPLGIKKVPCP